MLNLVTIQLQIKKCYGKSLRNSGTPLIDTGIHVRSDPFFAYR